MAREPEEGPPEFEEEEGGGPVKSFLEHLEDLRWTLIKSISAILVAMFVCLMAGKQLVAFLTWPLAYVQSATQNTNQIPVYLGTNIIGNLSSNEFGSWSGGSNKVTAVRLVPRLEGTNLTLGIQPEFKPIEIAAKRAVKLNAYSPLAGILVAMKLGLYGGLVLASPFLFYFIGQFVLPALKVTEKQILYRAVGFGTILFLMGVAFCYFIMMAVALGATVQFSQWLGFGSDEWRAEDYISFVCKFMLGMGLGFELPVVILTLVKIGLLNYEQLKKFRAYAIVGNLVIAAFATPSADPVTMFLMALPLQVLYEISTAVAGFWERRDRKREEAARAASGLQRGA